MSSRGGKREGAGRPSKNKPTTKATVYVEDRELINSYAQELNMPVNDLINKVIHHKGFIDFINQIKSTINNDDENK